MTKRPHHRTLAAQLHDWSDEQLATLVELRPGLCAAGVPADLGALGQRAQAQASIVESIRTTTMAESRLLQIIVCLPHDAPLTDLAAALPDGNTLDDIEPVLQQLEAKALVWRHDGRLHFSGALVQAMPTTFGPPLRELVEPQTVDYLRHVIRTLRENIPPDLFELPPPPAGVGGRVPRKADLVTELHELLAVPGVVAAVANSLPASALDLLHALSRGRPYRQLTIDLSWYSSYSSSRHTNWQAAYPEFQLYERGFFLPLRGVGFLPREVGLALVGGKPVSDLRLTPVDLVVGRAEPSQVDEHAGAAVATTLHQLADLLGRFTDAPAKALKTGGMGVTVMKQAAAALEVEVERANLLTELLHVGGLLAEQTVSRKERRQLVYETTYGPSKAAGVWREREPAVQWRQLAVTWLNAEYWPSATGRKDGEVKAPAVLADHHAHGAAAVRRSILEVLTELEPGQASSRDALTDAAYWRRPYGFSDATAQDPYTRLGWIYGEAEVLGIVADGALSTFGRALIDGRHADAEAALRACLPEARSEFTIQADLTAMAVGTLERSVLVELRLLADIESTGAATTFRFTEMSLGRALDAGRNPSEILAFLERHATKGVPKPLTFLINDVARRHGHLQVGAASAFIVSEDPAVLADAVSHRKTKKLQLRLLSPTVAVSPVAADKVVAGLRDAGFFPTADGELGAPVELAPLDDDIWRPRHIPAARAAGDDELPQPFAAYSVRPRSSGSGPIDRATALELARQIRAGQDTTPPAGLAARLGLDALPDTFDDAELAAWLDVPSDDATLVGLLEEAIDASLVLALTLVDDDPTDPPLLFLPLALMAPTVDGVDVANGAPLTIGLPDIASAMIIGSTNQREAERRTRKRQP